MDDDILTNLSPVDGVKETPTYSQTMQTLRERVALPDDYRAKMEARRAFEETLNPEPSTDDPIAMERYQTAIEDKSLGWKYLALYESFGIAKILSDRIARIRKEIKDDRRHGIECDRLHMSWWLHAMLELVERHEALTSWIEKHADQTIVCFSNDSTDLDSYGYGYGYVDNGEDGYGRCYMETCKCLSEDYLKQHECKYSSFEDPTMWDYMAGFPGSERYYVAFENKADAERFLLQYCSVAPLRLWKDVPPRERKQ
jgi:hypothetical protein